MSNSVPPGWGHVRIQVGDSYEVDTWASWLGFHNLNIGDVRTIDFYSDDTMRVYQYARDGSGQAFVDTYGNIVMQDPVTVPVVSMPPAWVHNKDRDYSNNVY